MNKSFKIQKVKRVLRLSTTDFEPANYIVYKVSGPRKLVKYFGFKKDAEAWVKDYTTKHPMTSDQMYDFYKGR
jgi:hypothetical protein